MEGESQNFQGQGEQALVDIPVVVENRPKVLEKKSTKKWWWMALVIFLLVAGGIGYRFWSLPKQEKAPDLTIEAPLRVSVVPTMIPPVVSGPAVLADKAYRNEANGFEIIPPAGWIKDESGKTGAQVIFTNPVKTKIGEREYATTISVEARTIGQINFADQVAVIKEEATKSADFKILDDLTVYLQARQYYLFGGTYTVNGLLIRRRSLMTIYKDRGYAITASGPAAVWASNEEIINASIYSFKLL